MAVKASTQFTLRCQRQQSDKMGYLEIHLQQLISFRHRWSSCERQLGSRRARRLHLSPCGRWCSSPEHNIKEIHYGGMARLSWPGQLVTQWDGLPAQRLSPIQLLTQGSYRTSYVVFHGLWWCFPWLSGSPVTHELQPPTPVVSDFDLPAASLSSYHDIVAACLAVGHSPSPVRWPAMCCPTTSETHRSVPTFSERGWRRICFRMHLDT